MSCISSFTWDIMSHTIEDMKAIEFNNHLEILGFNQSGAAAWLQVTPRTVRRWQNGEQAIPETVADLLMACRQLQDNKIPWNADLESLWRGDKDQIQRHQSHAVALAELLRRVEKRGGVSAPWQISLKEHSATLGPMTVRFYELANGSFSLANYRRSDKGPDIHRDWTLIEEAVAAYAKALSKANEDKRPGNVRRAYL